MRTLPHAVVEFVRPIPDDALPQLVDHRRLGMRIGSLGAVALVPGSVGFFLVALALGVGDPGRGALLAAANAAWFVALHVACRADGRSVRQLDLLQLGSVVGLLGSCAGVAWSAPEIAGPILGMMVALPVVAVLIAPCRPLLALSLVAPTLLAIALGEGLRVDGPPTLAEVTVLLALGFGATAALAAQITRRVWRRLATADLRLHAAERMSAIGRMTAGVAHELKTPLAALQNQHREARALCDELGASIGADGVTEADLREIAGELGAAVAAVGAASERAMGFVHAIREQARGTGDRADVVFRPADRVAGIALLLGFRLRRAGVALDADGLAPAGELVGDPGRFDQILGNLIGNAIDAYEAGGARGAIRVSALADGDGVTIAVEDDAGGIAEEVAGRLFEPMFTTRGAAGGSGLGLAIARDLARSAFGGDLVLARRAPGARFELRCPRPDTVRGRARASLSGFAG